MINISEFVDVQKVGKEIRLTVKFMEPDNV